MTKELLQQAYDGAFGYCSGRAKRTDLFAEIGSSEYIRDREFCLSFIALPSAAEPTALLQQALAALLEYDYAKTDKADRLGSAAIYALRIAIYQPAPDLQDEPVAEVIECSIRGGQTIREIEGRLKFLKFGTPLYTRVDPATEARHAAQRLQVAAQLAGRDKAPLDVDDYGAPYLHNGGR